MGLIPPYPVSRIQILLFVALMAEVLSSTFWLEIMSINACRWIHFLSGVIIGGCILVKTNSNAPVSLVHKSVNYLILMSLTLWIGLRLTHLFELNPLDFTQADMLPVIEVMARRFTQFQPVYQLIPEIWDGVMPVYLPSLWLPFVPAVVLGFDLRWITTFFILAGLFSLFAKLRPGKFSLMVWIPVGLWFDFILYNKTETLVLSEEGVVYGYFIVLALVLYLRSYFWIGVILACCLLSRYSIAFLTVAIMVCFYLYENVKYFKRVLTGAAATGLILITLGGAWTQLIQFIRLPGQYIKNLETNPEKYQEVMNNALGFVPWMPSLDYPLIYWIMLLTLVVVAILTVYLYKKLPGPFVLLAGLKFTVLFFYHFILIPYPYLFYTSVWLSVAIFYIYINHSPDVKSPAPL